MVPSIYQLRKDSNAIEIDSDHGKPSYCKTFIMKNYLTPLIIIAVCALCLGPLFSGFFGPDWRARWMLAWAANEYQNGNPVEAEDTLKRAGEMSSLVATDPEFWNLKFDFVFNKEKPSSEEISRLFEESMASIARTPDPYHATIASWVAELFHLRQENGYAVQAMEKTYPPISKRNPVQNNAIAYFRSLAKIELETALLEINTALVSDGTSNEEFLDTKAWVLHGLKEDEKALPFAEQSLKKFYAKIENFPSVRASDRLEFHAWLMFGESKTKDSALATESRVEALESKALPPAEEMKIRFSYVRPYEIDRLIKSLAALRFHRACILDELGRDEDSELDFAWLDRFGFTDTDKIN